MGVPDLGGVDLAQSYSRCGIAHASAKAMALPKEMLELSAAIDAIGAEKERCGGSLGYELVNTVPL